MELDEFVRATLTQIINGVDLAKKDHPDRIAVRVWQGEKGDSGKGVKISNHDVGFLVDFDVEVTAATKGGGKLSIGMAGFGGGAEGARESSRSNRIRFSVPIDYQTIH
jgi:hypothetical protein